MASIIQRGNAYRAMIRARGQSISRTFDTRAQAEAWAHREEHRIARGATAPEIARTPASVTVAGLFDRYAKEVSPTKRSGIWEQRMLSVLAKDPLFQCEALALDSSTMASWRDIRMQQVQAATVTRELIIMSAVMTRAIKEWRLPLASNPIRQIQWPKRTPARRRRVSDDERTKIVGLLGWDRTSPPVTIHTWIAWAFCFALETMMRRGEVLALRWKHVHPKHVHLPMTKNGESRDVPLSSAARSLIAILKRGGDEHRVVPVNQGTFGVYWRKTLTDAGIRDLHFHDTRREALTRMATKLSVIELARSSGHSGTGALMGYYRPSVTDLADKLD